MKRRLSVVAAIIACCLSVTAQKPPSPDDGAVKNGVYTNNYFAFSVTPPAGWVVHDEATNVHLKEVGKERAEATGALTKAQSEALLKNTYQLLTTFEHPLGTPGIVNSGFAIIAENVRHAPGIVTGRDYFAAARSVAEKMGARFFENEPLELTVAGRKFFQHDMVTPVQEITVHQKLAVTIVDGFALVFMMTGKDEPTTAAAMKSLQTLKFNNPPPPKPIQP